MNTIEKIHARINEAIIKKRDKPRQYLGASVLGAECARQVWYYVNDPKEVEDPTVLRKFAVGKALEPTIVQFFIDAGYKLFCTGDDQIRFEDGGIAGSGDGVIKGIEDDENTPYLLEAKTANSFYFKEFAKKGVAAVNEKYFGQVQVYMRYFKLKKCLFVAMNKDSQELYLEIIHYDEFEAVRLIERAKHLLTMKEEPERHFPSKSYFKCAWCSWKKTCWSDS